ncbi:MAG TPA: TIGR00366 family protein [Candidatus Bathyarchaeia archaeon]|nr:TIGR00366 family protein [Candidatus Bathyarchaeia archaeon]
MKQKSEHGFFEKVGYATSDWTETWFPDAFVFVLIASIAVFILGLALRNSPYDLAIDFGKGFWTLLAFSMQMVLIIVGGFLVATSPPVLKIIQGIAGIPKTAKSGVAIIGLFAVTTGMISWGFSLIFSGLLVREVSSRIKIDIRAAGAAAYLSLGSIWALGLSSSAALLMATQSSVPPALLSISGVLPLSSTIFLWQSLLMAVVLIVVHVLIAYSSAPSESKAVTAKFEPLAVSIPPRKSKGEWLEYSPVLSILVFLIGATYLGYVFYTQGGLAALDLNTFNMLFIMAGLILHYRPISFLNAVNNSISATAGVVIQFPFYAGIFGMIVYSTINLTLAHWFVSISTTTTYPLIIGIYTIIIGFFVPSGGGKFVLEAPYIFDAAKALNVNLGWVVQTYNAAEALPNLINPFWMLPLLGLLKVKARDLVGYSVIHFIITLPIVLILLTILGLTLPYVPPHT